MELIWKEILLFRLSNKRIVIAMENEMLNKNVVIEPQKVKIKEIIERVIHISNGEVF